MKCLTSPNLRNKAILFISYTVRICFVREVRFCCLLTTVLCVVFILSQRCFKCVYIHLIWVNCDKCGCRQLKITNRGQMWWLFGFCLVISIAWNHHPDYFNHDVCMSTDFVCSFSLYLSIYNTHLNFVNPLSIFQSTLENFRSQNIWKKSFIEVSTDKKGFFPPQRGFTHVLIWW